MKKFDGRLNSFGRNGQPLQCRVCKSIAHFERNCPDQKRSGDTEGNMRSDHFLTSSMDDEDVVGCKISDVYVGDAFNHMVLDTCCPHNVASKIWVDCFFEGLGNEEQKSPSTTKFKFGGGRVLQSLYNIQAPILVADCHVTISFDAVESDIPLLLGKKTMKNWHLVIDASGDTAGFTINGERNHVELFTSKSGQWCIEMQPNFPLEAISVMFLVAHLSKEEKVSVAERLHRQFCHPPYQFLKKILMNFGEVDKGCLKHLRSIHLTALYVSDISQLFPSQLLETCLILRK